jgi:hypothetical protein
LCCAQSNDACPARPSRLKAISMPNARSDVFARRGVGRRVRGEILATRPLAMTWTPLGHRRRSVEGLMRSPSRQFAQPSIHGRESLRGRPRSRPRVPPCGLRHTPARMCQRARKPSHKRSTRGRNQPFAAAAPNEPWGGSAIHSATEDVRPCNLKNTPNLSLGAPPVLAQVRQSQKNCALRQVRSCDDAFSAVENDRSGSLKEHFFAIRIKLADREAPPACETAQRIGEPSRKVR